MSRSESKPNHVIIIIRIVAICYMSVNVGILYAVSVQLLSLPLLPLPYGNNARYVIVHRHRISYIYSYYITLLVFYPGVEFFFIFCSLTVTIGYYYGGLQLTTKANVQLLYVFNYSMCAAVYFIYFLIFASLRTRI